LKSTWQRFTYFYIVFLKPALKCSLLQEVGDFEAKGFILMLNRQFLVASFMS
jgi:hypothetical protein